MHFSRTTWLFFVVIYFIIINILFTLPGNAFPSDDWMNRVGLDKWIHIGIFFGLVVLLDRAFWQPAGKHWSVIITATILYGIAVEIMQDRLIIHRSFDPWDWCADIAGILLARWFCKRYEKK